MVNASLNWASIIGIVLAAGGAMLYFMRSFKPALARDYDVFFAAIGLLCGGILFFQGWRLDPILQFGQFLLAGSTVFFAYESVRLRGVTTEQARKASYLDEEESFSTPSLRSMRGSWESQVDRFDQTEPKRRRIGIRQEDRNTESVYRRRPSSRPIIPERAASRRVNQNEISDINNDDWGQTLNPFSDQTRFGERRDQRQHTGRGNRPIADNNTLLRSKRFDSGRNFYPGMSNKEIQENYEEDKKDEKIEKRYSSLPGENKFKSRSTRIEDQNVKRSIDKKEKEDSSEKVIRDNTFQFDD